MEGTAEFFSNMVGVQPGMFWAVVVGCCEFFGGILVLLGLFTRAAAAAIASVMVVAILTVHRGTFFLPQGSEFALTLLAASVALILAGGGAASLDSRLQSRQP